ncbi:MAG: hypothetical protein GWM89_00095 [Candidatus Dadabacteria bacterium]|nr:hypothetical protein [Candidatus Dadabacteria bacterium]NIY20843.1 hypothetical protein [Candidatus Dadabacteria bacterium]
MFDSSFNFLYRFGSRGNIEGLFNEPIGVVVNSLNVVIIADTNNNRIQVFSQDYLPTGVVPPNAGPPPDSGPPAGRGRPSFE